MVAKCSTPACNCLFRELSKGRLFLGIVSMFLLLEKGRLLNSVSGFLKVAQANTDETIALPRTEINPFS